MPDAAPAPATAPVVRPLHVKVTCGAEDPERCNQGLTVAATAVAAGADVSVWLTGQATWLAVAGRPPDRKSTRLNSSHPV